MRSEVTDRRSGRAGLVLEVDDALLERDEQRVRRERFRDRRPKELVPGVALAIDRTVCSDQRGGRVLRVVR